MVDKIRVGSLWYTSWGYDQTNYDFIIVVSISPSKKTAMCSRVKTNMVEGGTHSLVEPTRQPYGDTFRMRVVKRGTGDETLALRGSYPPVNRLDTFYPHNEGKVYYQTER